MNGSRARPAGLVPVHIGQPAPTPDDPIGREGDVPEAVRLLHRQAQFPLVEPNIDWQQHGVEPRWVGLETSDCAAALNPNVYPGLGAEELKRFLEGARRREEIALLIATIGNAEEDSSTSVLARYDPNAASGVPGLPDSIKVRRLPAGTRPTLADGLDAVDRDLALRLLNRPATAPWWALALIGRRGAWSSIAFEPEGDLHAVLVDPLGAPVVAAWTPPAGDQRWYVIPDATDWNSVIGWLIQQALPVYVPDALRRARSPHFVDPDLQTPAEQQARNALAELEQRYDTERARLEDALQQAKATAEPVRYGLLYGTGKELVDAVDTVLRQAGFATEDLDVALSGTRSADLLVTFQQQRRLIEVKAASGAASESLVGDVQRHLTTWPTLRPQEPVGGGVLIVNHHHRLDPPQRAPQVYSRREFIDTLTVSVISTRTLFDWWRAADWAAIHDAILGSQETATAADDDDGKRAARRLAGQAHEVGRVSGRQPWREVLRLISRSRLGRPRSPLVIPQLTTPWQDTVSAERSGWRQRAANLHGEFAFAVDYTVCRFCRLGWVEQPYTLPQYQRCGLARAGLAALRAEHPRLAWHTLGGHFADSQPFWAAVGADVPGGYQQHPPCPHITRG